jgi:hypothetical protein
MNALSPTLAPSLPEDFPRALKASAAPGAAEIPVDLLRASSEELSEHSLTGPSSAGRIMACPGSLRVSLAVQEDAPEDEDSPDSARGTMLHKATATFLMTLRLPEGMVADDILTVQWMVQQMDELRRDCARAPNSIELIEDRVDLRDCGAGWGTVDYAVLVPGSHGICMDAKFGARAVPHPRHNWQMLLYGHGLCRAFGLQRIELVILRPAADAEWQVMRWETSAESLAELARAYSEAVRLAEMPDAPLVVGEHCTFCKGKALCPARWATSALVPRHGTWSALIRTMDPMHLRDTYERAKIAASQFGALAAAIEDLAVADPIAVRLHGYEVRSSRGRRDWADEKAAAAKLRTLAEEKGKDPALLFTAPELISPAQAEKVLGKAAAVAAVMDPLIITRPGSLGLHKATP